jgi:hypothetical protein
VQQAQPSEEDACFAAQVSALLTTARLKALDAVAVLVEKSRLKTRYLIAAATTGDDGQSGKCLQGHASSRNDD